MFLPIGDAPNPPGFRAWMTWLLILANVAVYLGLTLPMSLVGVDPADPRLAPFLEIARDRLPPGAPLHAVLARLTQWDLFVMEWGYQPGDPAVVDLFTSMFLHGGLLHLLGNMLFLWIYGDNVEHRLGRIGFLAAYLLTGVAATLGFSLFAGDSLVPMVGASGAISGVLGLYFLLFPRNQVKILVAFFPLFLNVWFVPARVVLGFYLVIENLLPMLGGLQSGVAYGAHIGGFVAGLALAFVGERLDWRWPWVQRPAGVGQPMDLQERIRQAARLDAQGQHAAAVRLLRAGLDRAQGSEAARLHYAIATVLIRRLGLDPRLLHHFGL